MYINYRFRTPVEEMKGKTFSDVKNFGEYIKFTEPSGIHWFMYHDQDCCESVTIEDICGDLNDLVDSEILLAEESGSDDGPVSNYDESYTWTFYRFRTMKGSVVIRWYGTSNGYYSESVDVYRVPAGEPAYE